MLGFDICCLSVLRVLLDLQKVVVKLYGLNMLRVTAVDGCEFIIYDNSESERVEIANYVTSPFSFVLGTYLILYSVLVGITFNIYSLASCCS